jgi:chemotaxis protein CheX
MLAARRVLVAGNVGEGGDQMTVSLRDSVERVANPHNLDVSVEEVFRLMMGVECRRSAEPLSQGVDWVTAVVGFGGLLSGACVFRAGGEEARTLATHLTGMDFAEIDDTVKDGFGELCNMIAGSWKAKVPELSAGCGLSVPAVITGRDYTLRVQAPEFKLQHVYVFENVCFEVTIICDGLQ